VPQPGEANWQLCELYPRHSDHHDEVALLAQLENVAAEFLAGTPNYDSYHDQKRNHFGDRLYRFEQGMCTLAPSLLRAVLTQDIRRY
jgi:uncharacterized short protein YbdD (DUF466 family)